MSKITIAGKDHEITKDGFDVTYIDGLLVDDFMMTLSGQELGEVVGKGLKIAKEDPARFDDIAARSEIDPVLSDMMKKFATEKL